MELGNQPYAVVVGGVNIDICGRPNRPPVPRDSNPGRVYTSLGGVGRNIAHNMSLLGLPTALVTALGDDGNARLVEESCQALGLDLSHSLAVPGGATSTYLFITDHRGEMELAVSDMDIYRHLTPEYMEGQLPFLNAARLVVMDTNLPAETVEFLARRCTAPLFADPVSTVKAEKLRPVLGKIHTLKPNRLEAALLTGVDIVDEASLHRAAEKLLEAGVGRVFLSLGSRGVFCADEREHLYLPVYKGAIQNTTGAGDAFMAALAWGYWNGCSLASCGRAGLAAATLAAESTDTINPSLSHGAILELIHQNKEELI